MIDAVAALAYLEARSESEPNSGCRLWSGTVDNGGYGCACMVGKHFKAHRLSWIAHNGEIPQGIKVLHRCDTPPCINPSHLFLGTQQDNIADMVAKGRQRGVQRFGADSPVARLTEHNVWVIRNVLDIDFMPQCEVARLWGVSPMTISRIARNISWPGIGLDWDRKA